MIENIMKTLTSLFEQLITIFKAAFPIFQGDPFLIPKNYDEFSKIAA